MHFSHQQKIALIGSCFSDEMLNKLKYAGFNVKSNPFGTIFHPLSIAKFILDCFNEDYIERIIQQNDVFLSLDAGSKIYGLNVEEYKNKLKVIRNNSIEDIASSSHLFITFGTSWAYLFEQEIVGNCHKIPAHKFEKKISDVNEIVDEWKKVIQQLHHLNPGLNIVFTVSPVRHLKDGLIENSRSKARLILACEELSILPNCSYFPAYEMVIDELRDYQYFKEDLAHPNEKAINFVWKKLLCEFTSIETQQLCQEIEQLRKASAHKYIHPESKDALHHQEVTHLKIQKLIVDNPFIIW